MGRLKDAAGRVTVGELAPKHRECSTLTEASGSVVVHRLDGRAGRAVETERMLVSLTAGCGMRSEDIRLGSLLQPP